MSIKEEPGKLVIQRKVGFIGAGNMAQAIATRMLDAAIITPDLIAVSAPSENNFAFWKSRGIHTTHVNGEVIRKSEIVILAMKPQHLDEALKSFDPVPTDKLYISVLVGIPIKKINEKLQTHYGYVHNAPVACRVIRVMPNPPILLGDGATACATSEVTKPEDILSVKTIFSAGGLFEMVPEHLIDAVNALSGSGTAYMYLVIEALCDGAVKMGVPRALAMKLACRTLVGSAKMVEETGKHPGLLKDEACSAGGTTITGIHVLERSGVRAALMEAVETATNRSIELGNKI